MRELKSSLFVKALLWVLFLGVGVLFSVYSGRVLETFLYIPGYPGNAASYEAYINSDVFYTELYNEGYYKAQNALINDFEADDPDYSTFMEAFDPEETNLVVWITDSNGAPVVYNGFIDNLPVVMDGAIEQVRFNGEMWNIQIALNDSFPADDSFRYIDRRASELYSFFSENTARAGALGAGLLALLICMMSAAGYRKNREDIALLLVDRIPFEIYLIAYGAGIAAVLFGLSRLRYTNPVLLLKQYGPPAIFAVILAFTHFLLSLTRRSKAGYWYRNTIAWKLSHLFGIVLKTSWNVLSGIPHPIAAFAGFTAYWLLFFIFVNSRETFLCLLMACAAGVCYAYMLYADHQIREGQRQIAQGNLDTVINKRYLFGYYRKQAIELEEIRGGIASAVTKEMQSERMKSELIANVSHDIKTPLTSVINYVDLLRTCNDEEQREEYMEILRRNADRLKQLTTDIIEASRASSGSIEVHSEKMNLTELLQQAEGEFEDRMLLRNLNLIVKVPEEPLYVKADGRLLWRVMSNLLSNCVKYSMEGTRIYLEAETADDRVLVSMKNISSEALNISAEELKQRFVRGDSSRHSEGSGLGLNIAESLLALMNGSLRLEIDGDLFKTYVSLPCYKE